MTIQIKTLSPMQWANLSAGAHLAVFDKRFDPSMERIAYAYLAVDAATNLALGYATVRELDSETAHLQYGGVMPDVRNSLRVTRCYTGMLTDLKNRYKRVGTHIEADNVAYLRLAMAHGFRIIGTRNFKGDVLVELLLEFSEG